MTTTLLTPVEFGAASQSGATLWRKQLLPLGEISYKGRKIAFTKDYLNGLVKAFRDHAYDVVPFQFADSANTHSNAPEQRRGTVRDLLLTDDGLDLILEAGETASKHLSEYPDLGVSARIVEGYDRADGKFFPAAIQHVLGTLDPRIPGMRPWQAVEAANDDGDVIDLTDAAATSPPEPSEPPQPEPAAPAATATEENPMALTEAQEARLKTLLDLPEEKFSALLADPEPDDDEELSDEEIEALLAEIPDDEPGDGKDAKDSEPAPEDGKVPAGAGASLTAEAQAAIDLANSRAEEAVTDVARLTAALDATNFEKERETFARQHGIPPRITDLARPLLEGTGRTVDLANGSSADAGSIMRKVLAEVGKTVKMLDLSAELGTEHDSGAAEKQAAEERRIAERSQVKAGYAQMAGLS